MNVLITGKLSAVSYSFCEQLTAQSQIVASSDDINPEYIGKINKVFNHPVATEEFARLFHVYSFDSVVFFLGEINLKHPDYSVLENLDRVLSLCAKNDVERLIFVSSTYIYNGAILASEGADIVINDNATVLLNSCRSLCNAYHNSKGIDVITLYAPCLYGYGENRSLIGTAVYECSTKDHIGITGPKGQLVDFLSLEDLGVLVSHIFDAWDDTHTEIILSGAVAMTLMQISELFKGRTHVTRLTFSNDPYASGPKGASTVANRTYDWTPVHRIDEEINDLLDNVCAVVTEKKSLWKRITETLSSKKFILIAVEIALGYLAMEILNRITSTAVQFQYIDFRLLYVVLISIVHGLVPGIAASLLACVSILSAYISGGLDAAVVMYSIDRWLPFACYIMVGASVGYIKSKKEKQISALSDENKNLVHRYTFLSELYDNAIGNKDRYRKQIVSYRNSFGRIFDVTRKLNHLLPDAVFREALLTLEDVLENNTVSIYNMSGKSGFARLCVCSKKIAEETPASIRVDKYGEAIKQLKKGEVWANTNRLQDYPDYIFPIYKADELLSIVMIYKVDYSQMSMYFENLVFILCSLIEDSLLRALDYMDKIGDYYYLADSKIMNASAFKGLLSVRDAMEQEAMSSYSLIAFDVRGEEVVKFASSIRRFFRDNDVFGLGEDGSLRVLLSGANSSSVGKVLERLEQNGILSVTVIK